MNSMLKSQNMTSLNLQPIFFFFFFFFLILFQTKSGYKQKSKHTSLNNLHGTGTQWNELIARLKVFV